jgi:hypothetical protein
MAVRPRAAFWPARNKFEELLQAEKRAKFLIDQQYATFEAIRRSYIDSPRLNLPGHPSCGKTFLLVRLAAERAMLEGSQRILLLSHSPLLQPHIARSGCAAGGWPVAHMAHAQGVRGAPTGLVTSIINGYRRSLACTSSSQSGE